MNIASNAARWRRITRNLCATLVMLLSTGGSSAFAQTKWHFGVGTGMTFMNVEGDQGGNIAGYGPVQLDVDLDPNEFSDLMESGFGFAGYATDGTWMIQYALAHITLGGSSSGELSDDVGGGTVAVDLDFEITNGKITLGRTVYRSKTMKFAFAPYAGLRYLKHDINADIEIRQATTSYIYRGRDYNWTDALLGASISYRLTPRFSWSASGDAGFGGSDGTYSFTTSLTFSPTRHFAFGPNFSYTAIDYENGAKGDADWYLYDADEFGVGIALLVNF